MMTPLAADMVGASIEIIERLDKAGVVEEIFIGRQGEVLVKVTWGDGYLVFPMRPEVTRGQP